MRHLTIVNSETPASLPANGSYRQLLGGLGQADGAHVLIHGGGLFQFHQSEVKLRKMVLRVFDVSADAICLLLSAIYINIKLTKSA